MSERRNDQSGFHDWVAMREVGMRVDRSNDSPFREWLRLLSRRWWVVVATVVVTTLTAFVVSRSEQRLYQATATVLVSEQNPAAAVLNLASTNASPPDRYAATQAALARVGGVATMAIATAATVNISFRIEHLMRHRDQALQSFLARRVEESGWSVEAARRLILRHAV